MQGSGITNARLSGVSGHFFDQWYNVGRPSTYAVLNLMLKISFNNGALAALCLVLLAGAPAAQKRKPATDAAQQLRQLLAEEWQYELKSNPESATYLGDKRYNSQLTDYSPAARRKDAETNRDFLQKFQAIDARGLTADEALNRTLSGSPFA